MLKSLAVCALLLGTTVVQAEEIRPLGARSIQLGSVNGVAYFTQERDGFRIVATIADGEDGTPIRVSATLADGQSLRVSVPHGAGEMEEAMEFFRDGDVLGLRDPLEARTASIR